MREFKIEARDARQTEVEGWSYAPCGTRMQGYSSLKGGLQSDQDYITTEYTNTINYLEKDSRQYDCCVAYF